ncbi:hypothetical protein G7046_g7845 [Stylonectria norvegica]|nr:hypothetical protein G7046_g7845 [Stylonectria norvegica]
MDKSSAVSDGTPGVARSTSRTTRPRSNTPDLSTTSSTTTATTTTGSQTSKPSTANNSVGPSPLASRDSSPTRPPRRAASATRIPGNRPRKNSQDPSPSRQTRSGIPAHTNSSRSFTSLSSTITPTLLPASQEPQQIQPPASQRINHTPDLRESPRWPVSPRLRSPPPQLSNRPIIPSRRSEQELPSISVQRPSPSPQPSEPQQTTPESEMEDPQLQSGVRTPARGALETVQEVSLPNSPNPTNDTLLLEKVKEKLSSLDNHSDSSLGDVRTLRARPNLPSHESGSDSGNGRDQRSTTSVPPPLITRQSSALSTKQMKSKQEPSMQSMTVETETVPSIPQVALATGPKAEANGTLKTKPSSETIRPKKEKKKTTRKQPAVNAGTGEALHPFFGQAQPKLRHHQSMNTILVAPDACLPPTSPRGDCLQNDELGSPRQLPSGPRTQSLSFHPVATLLTRARPASSKADVFEAKIANAIDETNTSDSEETFVYDSNPPDNNDRAGRRFHSRTPSATSMVSQADRQNLRSIYGVLEGAGPAHGPKKSMKFVNTFTSNGNESLAAGEDDGNGTGRSAGGSARGTARHHHHIGRWGRQPGNGHASLFDNESPFPNAARSKLVAPGSRTPSGPPSPRNNQSARGPFSKRTSMQMSSSYDLDDTTGADDERTPLMGSVRSARSNRNRRGPHSLRQAESQTFTRRSSYLNRFAACLVLAMMLMLLVAGAIGFMFATSQPMTGIEITAIHNVVTSEQVLMFDVTVKAHNPNIVVVTIDQANLEIFAKSEHAGTDSDWWDRPRGPKEIDSMENDPPLDDGDDDDDLKPNVLLGRIMEFDSPLTFEGSLFHQGTSSSTGEMQLAYPGNATSGGSKRWERIFQNEFDLIIKGVVKYSLPLSTRVRSATVSGRKTIKPNSANDPPLPPNSTTLDTSR